MVAWPGVTWDYIEGHWTDSQYAVLLEAARKRTERERAELDRDREDDRSAYGGRRSQMGGARSGTMSASGGAGIASMLGIQGTRYPRLKSDRLKREQEH